MTSTPRPALPEQIKDLSDEALHLLRRLGRGDKIVQRHFGQPPSVHEMRGDLARRQIVKVAPTTAIGTKVQLTLLPAGENLLPIIHAHDADVARWLKGQQAADDQREAIRDAAVELYEALKPFLAEYHRLGLSSLCPDGERLGVMVTAGDVRRAAAAIKAAEPKPEKDAAS